MELRQLGNTGLTVSSAGLGASSLGGGVFGDVPEADAIRIVHLSLDMGVRLIDVAPFYGATRAEAVLGKALKSIPRNKYLLATKVGRYGDAMFDFSGERARRSVDESLRRLGTDYVDILQVHDVEYGDLQQIERETLPVLDEVVRSGKARLIGVTGYPLKPLRQVARRVKLDTVLSYNHYSLNDTTLLSVLPELKATGLGIINAGALSQGLLTSRGTPTWHPAPPLVKQICADLAEFVRNQGSDIAKLAIQFSTSNTDIATTLIGTTSSSEMERNLRWIDEPMDLDLLGKVQHRLAAIKDVTWFTGLPENN